MELKKKSKETMCSSTCERVTWLGGTRSGQVLSVFVGASKFRTLSVLVDGMSEGAAGSVVSVCEEDATVA